MDDLRDDLAKLFEEEGRRFFTDPWAARDAYIAVILDRSPENIHAFFEAHAKANLTQDERVWALKLLEMQRHAMLMYTSCGWFFADISGLETVQVMRYAARAIQLGEALGGRNLEIKFLDELKKAKSNIPYWLDGRRVYEKLVKPTVVGFAKVVNHYAIRAQFKVPLSFQDSWGHRGNEGKAPDRIYHYRVERLDEERRSKDGKTIMVGRVAVASGITLEQREYGYCLLRPAEQEFRCFVKRVTDDQSYVAAKKEILARWEQGLENLESFIRERLGAHELGLSDMFFEEREAIVRILIQDKMAELGRLLSEFYEKNFQLILMIHRLGLAIPKELRGPAEYTLSARLEREIEASADVAQPSHFKAALQIVKTAERFGFALNTETAAKIFQKRLEDRLASLYEHPDLALCRDALQLLDIAEKLKIRLQQNRLQDWLWLMLREKTLPLIERVVSGKDSGNSYELVTELLRLAYKLNFNIDEYKQRLKPLEERLSQDPRFWP